MADKNRDSALVHLAVFTEMYEAVSFLKTEEGEKEEVEEEKTQLLRTSKEKGNDHQGKADGEN